jgi:hypothetical protein
MQEVYYTGKAGKFFVKTLLSKDFNIKVLLRNPESLQISNSLVEVLKGDAMEFFDIKRYILNNGSEC